MRYAPPSSRQVSPYSAPPDVSASAASGPNGRPQKRSCSLSSLPDDHKGVSHRAFAQTT